MEKKHISTSSKSSKKNENNGQEQNTINKIKMKKVMNIEGQHIK